MKKYIVKCKSCKAKMKIQDKKAKYRCPSCKTVNKIGGFDLKIVKIKLIYSDFLKFFKELKIKLMSKIKR